MNFFSLKTSTSFLKNVVLSLICYHGIALALSYLVTPFLLENQKMAAVASYQSYMQMVVIGTILWPYILAGFCVTLKHKPSA